MGMLIKGIVTSKLGSTLHQNTAQLRRQPIITNNVRRRSRICNLALTMTLRRNP